MTAFVCCCSKRNGLRICHDNQPGWRGRSNLWTDCSKEDLSMDAWKFTTPNLKLMSQELCHLCIIGLFWSYSSHDIFSDRNNIWFKYINWSSPVAVMSMSPDWWFTLRYICKLCRCIRLFHLPRAQFYVWNLVLVGPWRLSGLNWPSPTPMWKLARRYEQRMVYGWINSLTRSWNSDYCDSTLNIIISWSTLIQMSNLIIVNYLIFSIF